MCNEKCTSQTVNDRSTQAPNNAEYINPLRTFNGLARCSNALLSFNTGGTSQTNAEGWQLHCRPALFFAEFSDYSFSPRVPRHNSALSYLTHSSAGAKHSRTTRFDNVPRHTEDIDTAVCRWPIMFVLVSQVLCCAVRFILLHLHLNRSKKGSLLTFLEFAKLSH